MFDSRLTFLSNPLRTVAHCDIDAAYAQFEQVRLGIAEDVPLICAQWQSIIAVNYPARKYGIKRFTTIEDAKKMCPHLVVQHVATYRNGENEAGYWDDVDPRTHKVSLDVYRRESLKILAIFREMIPKGEIEKASIDEAFLDLTPMVIEELLVAHPYLAKVPDDAPNGLDSPLPLPPAIDWSRAGNVFPVNGKDGFEDEANDSGSEDYESEASEDIRLGARQPKDSWEDWALCKGAELMSAVRHEVYRKLHYTCSAGIAHNKSMAKLCSAWKKPNNQTILRASAVTAFLQNRDFTDIRSLGGKLGDALAAEYGSRSISDLLTVPLGKMQQKFGEESLWIYNIIRGIDYTEVKERVSNKSMLASKNVKPAVTTPEQGYHWLSILAGELNVRLRESREVAPSLWPKTLVLSYRQGIEPSRSRQTPFPFTRNLSTEYILKFGNKLWEEATQPMSRKTMKLNNIALSFTGLEKLEEGQQGIEGFFVKPKTENRTSPLAPPSKSVLAKRLINPSSDSSSSSIPTIDIPSKKPRISAPQSSKPKGGLEAFLTKNPPSSSSRSASPSLSLLNQTEIISDKGPLKTKGIAFDSTKENSFWICPQCKEAFTMPNSLSPFRDNELSIKSIKQEHEDWHFALSLQDGWGRQDVNKDESQQNNAKLLKEGKEKKQKAEGIKAFFTPKPQ
nr:DNA polymerase eta subunit [Cryptococcus depauperatus CBS 7855]